MDKIKKGDIIFSVYQRNIVSVNIALDSSIDSKRPKTLDKLDLWEEEGWMVKVEYNELDSPISINNNIDEILKLCPAKYSPFNKKGGGNQGYLYEIGKELGDYLMVLAIENNDSLKNMVF